MQDFKGWLYIFNKKLASALEKEKNERIKELTDRHCLMIQDEQGKMLKSILDKPYSIARLDRVLEEIDNSYQLYTNPKDILTKTHSFFQEQYNRSSPNLDLLSPEWKQIYEPQTEINEIWYKDLENNISEAEWLRILKELKNNTAPGITGIGYILIKQANSSS